MQSLQLIKDFNNIDKMRLFEIEFNNEYYIYNIEINETELYSNNISVPLDDIFSLDEHLCELYDLCYQDIIDNNKGYM